MAETKLSVIIVNYNVKHFLEQCLQSVFLALKNIPSEVFVVDNQSVDGSVELVREKFPNVILIANKDNVGFSKANNQAIRIAKGEYILLLNPDTLVEEDTFSKTISFMDTNSETGGLGVKMVDGTGEFLPESKRGLPSPAVAFYKIFGLSKLFPKSPKFAQYHLGHLSKDETNEVEILSGAFMLMRKSVLDKVGLLDETFFMYGEDIDLSYRIILGGYKNYYFADTTIIHYKGESTKKGSLNYVFVFYRAMVIFYNKHFSHKNTKAFEFLINLAIYLRASLSLFKRFINKLLTPLLDVLVLVGFCYFSSVFYQEKTDVLLDWKIVKYLLSGVLLLTLTLSYYNGVYDSQVKKRTILKTTGLVVLLNLLIYSLLPESLRTSRLLILTWGFAVLPALFSHRFLSDLLGFTSYFKRKKTRNISVIGNASEIERTQKTIEQASEKKPNFFNTDSSSISLSELGNILSEKIRIQKINELIFCAKNIPSKNIIETMVAINHSDLEYKIAPSESVFIIGSNSIHEQGDIYTLDTNTLTQPKNKRYKRTLDVFMAMLFLCLFPVLFLVKKPFAAIRNVIAVLFAKKTWVGLTPSFKLTKEVVIKPSVLFCCSAEEHEQKISTSNTAYLKNYDVVLDLKILLANFRNIGN
jgi:GT2 family glycosyltransferase